MVFFINTRFLSWSSRSEALVSDSPTTNAMVDLSQLPAKPLLYHSLPKNVWLESKSEFAQIEFWSDIPLGMEAQNDSPSRNSHHIYFKQLFLGAVVPLYLILIKVRRCINRYIVIKWIRGIKFTAQLYFRANLFSMLSLMNSDLFLKLLSFVLKSLSRLI